MEEIKAVEERMVKFEFEQMGFGTDIHILYIVSSLRSHFVGKLVSPTWDFEYNLH